MIPVHGRDPNPILQGGCSLKGTALRPSRPSQVDDVPRRAVAPADFLRLGKDPGST